jgi:hypothetical protein
MQQFVRQEVERNRVGGVDQGDKTEREPAAQMVILIHASAWRRGGETDEEDPLQRWQQPGRTCYQLAR